MTDSKTLTLRDVPHKLVLHAKMLTGKGTASQALLEATRRFIEQEDKLAEQHSVIAGQRAQIHRMQALLRSLAPLCIQVAEIAGQEDLFD